MGKITVINLSDLEKLAGRTEWGWVELSRVKIIDTDRQAKIILSARINEMNEVILALHEESINPKNENQKLLNMVASWKATEEKI